MKLNNKIRALAGLLALSLSTSGCASVPYKDPNIEDAYERIDDIMSENDFYQIANSDGTNRDSYNKFYSGYLKKFYPYMSNTQYGLFLDIVKEMDEKEEKNYENTNALLNQINGVDEAAFGHGFYHAFNSSILAENVSFRDSMSDINDIAILRLVIDSDEEFFKSVFSNDIDNLIDVIVAKTYCEDRSLVEELIHKLDALYDLSSSAAYQDEQLRISYHQRVSEIIGILANYKSQKDEQFNNSIFASILRESAFNGKDTYTISANITNDIVYLTIKDELGSYRVNDILKSQILYATDLEALKCLKANEIIRAAYTNEGEYYYGAHDTLVLLTGLIDRDIFAGEKEFTADRYRHLMYENLRDYFASEEEFNSFVLRLFDGGYSFLDNYFALFEARLKENGITYEDFLRYLVLVNYNDCRKHMHIEFNEGAEHIPSEEVNAMMEDEYEDIAYAIEENYFLGDSTDYEHYFDHIRELLANNNLGYEQIYNPDCEYVWGEQEIDIANEEDCSIISAPVYPSATTYNGANVVYYELPENYEENGQAVIPFYNISKVLTLRNAEGFKACITDAETGEMKYVFIVGINEPIEKFDAIYFTEKYSELIQSRNNMLRLTGGLYE